MTVSIGTSVTHQSGVGAFGVTLFDGDFFDAQFAIKRAAPPVLTPSRSSIAQSFDRLAVLQQADSDVARFDHTLANVSLGYRGEGQSTNEFSNNTMVGAVAATDTLPDNWSFAGFGGGVALDITEVGTENGLDFIEFEIDGTNSGGTIFPVMNWESAGNIAALTTEVWTVSFFWKKISGSLVGTVDIVYAVDEYDSGPSNLGRTDTQIITSTLDGTDGELFKYSNTTTLNKGANTAFIHPFLFFAFDNGEGASNFRWRMYLPQCEEQPHSSTSIKTLGSSAVTRNADSLSGTLAMPAGSTVIIKYRTPLLTSAAAVILFQWDDGTEDNRFTIRQNSDGTIHCVVQSAAGETADLAMGDPGDDVDSTIAMRIKVDDFSASRDGAAVVTDTAGDIPISATTIRCCADSADANAWASTCDFLTILDRPAPNNELQTLSA